MLRLKFIFLLFIGINNKNYNRELNLFIYNLKKLSISNFWYKNRGAEASPSLLNSIIYLSQAFKINNILEFGIGKSTELIQLIYKDKKLNHEIIEESVDWGDLYVNKFPNIVIKHSYDFEINNTHLIIIDGPKGKLFNSRNQILSMNINCRPIFIIDDVERLGEYMTTKKLFKKLNDYKSHTIKSDKWHTLLIPNELYFQYINL
jgi:hypothetical protein